VVAAVKFENGALGTIDATTAAYPGYAERIEMIGEKATASLIGSDLAVAYHDGRVSALTTEFGAGGTGADPMAFPNDWHRGVIADFLDALDQKRAPSISGHEALKVHRLIDALLEAGRTGETVRVAR
jgi:UDP-N-acetyl-2-amino-2-deoxyglucuronate dehydrogenase